MSDKRESENDTMGGVWFVYGEDLVAGLIGPFDSPEAAAEHVEFCRARGDADPGRVVTDVEAAALGAEGLLMMSPQQDREFRFPEDK